MRLNWLLLITAAVFLYACDDNEVEHDFGHRYSDTEVHTVPENYYAQVNASNTFEVDSYNELLQFWDSLDYTTADWDNGDHEVPRVFLTDITKNWSAVLSGQIPVKEKKHLFFYAIAPLVLRSNERILMDRHHLSMIKSDLAEGNAMEAEDADWLMRLADVYKVDKKDLSDTTDVVAALWNRVDIIPPSLALTQAAIESGWGTSRFTREGNSLFGQWAWGKDAIKPKHQREGMGNYGIKRFGSLQESVCAYMLNINTHNAYADLRDARSEMRLTTDSIVGWNLCESLDHYSERGQEYVVDLKTMMRQNKLRVTDLAYLSKADAVYVVLPE